MKSMGGVRGQGDDYSEGALVSPSGSFFFFFFSFKLDLMGAEEEEE